MKYVVITDHPYYPSCEYFDDLVLAEQYKAQAYKDLNADDGKHELKVTLAEIKDTAIGKSDY
jgi:hypothetical protein